MPAPTLDGRLLCASGAAYAITGDMKTLAPDSKNVYINGAGFVRPDEVTVFTAGPLAIDGCLVGEIQDGLVLAFRGTMPLDFNDPPIRARLDQRFPRRTDRSLRIPRRRPCRVLRRLDRVMAKHHG
jgi:hypothetical protein